MSVAINYLVKRIRRHFPLATFEYFVIWERTAKGWPHAHMLLRAPFIPQRWLSVQWSELTGARIVDIRPVRTPEAVAAYVAKYLTKDPQVPTGMKRYRFSKGFLSSIVALPPEHTHSPATWRLVPSSALELASTYSRNGYTVQLHQDGSYTLFPPGTANAPSFDSLSMWPPSAKVPA